MTHDGDYYEALARQEPDRDKRTRLLIMAVDADWAETDAAIARGELVLSPYGRLLPAGDPCWTRTTSPRDPPT